MTQMDAVTARVIYSRRIKVISMPGDWRTGLSSLTPSGIRPSLRSRNGCPPSSKIPQPCVPFHPGGRPMIITPWAELQPLYESAYREGVAKYGDLHLSFTDYAARLD